MDTDCRLLIVLNCQVLKEVGPLEKIGNPVPVDEASGSAPATNGNAQPATNTYAQPQKQVLQPSKPSQYVSLYNRLLMSSGNIAVYPIEGLSPYQNKYHP